MGLGLQWSIIEFLVEQKTALQYIGDFSHPRHHSEYLSAFYFLFASVYPVLSSIGPEPAEPYIFHLVIPLLIRGVVGSEAILIEQWKNSLDVRFALLLKPYECR